MSIFRQLRVTLRCAVLGVSSFVASDASAQAPATEPPEPALRMTWESDDPACSGDDVSVRALQMVTPGVTARPLRANVQVRREDDQWLVRLQTQSGDQSGQRILRAESCRELQEAIALLLAMAMESKGDVLSPESPAPAPPRAPAPGPEAVPSAPAAAAAAPGVEPRDLPPAYEAPARGVAFGWFLRLDGKAADGLKPGLGLGVGVTGGVSIGDFDIGVAAAHWPETRARAPERDAYVDVERQNLSLHACWNVWRVGGLVLAPCVAPGFTKFRFRSGSLRDTREGALPWQRSVTAAADLRYELVAGHLSLLLSPGFTWEQPRPFQIALIDQTDGEPPAGEPPPVVGEEEIYKTRGFGPRLEIGVDARF